MNIVVAVIKISSITVSSCSLEPELHSPLCHNLSRQLQWWNHHPCKYLKNMWHLETCVSGGLGSAGLMVGLDDLRGPFQGKMIP